MNFTDKIKNNSIAIDPGETSGLVHIIKNEIYFAGNLNPRELITYIKENNTNFIIIERIQNYGHAVGKSIHKTLILVGRIIQICNDKNIEYVTIPRIDVKRILCQNIYAKTKDIRQALINEYGAKGTKKNPGYLYKLSKHTWDAFAIYNSLIKMDEMNFKLLKTYI